MPGVNAFYGTATPDSTVSINTSLGTWTAQADDHGRWGQWVVLPNVVGTPSVSVSSSQGTLYPACGS